MKKDKKYVGQTCQRPEKRWNNGRGYIENIYFWRSIQKYGWDNFEHEVVASNLTKVGRTTVMNHCRNGKPFKDEFILRLEKI